MVPNAPVRPRVWEIQFEFVHWGLLRDWGNTRPCCSRIGIVDRRCSTADTGAVVPVRPRPLPGRGQSTGTTRQLPKNWYKIRTPIARRRQKNVGRSKTRLENERRRNCVYCAHDITSTPTTLLMKTTDPRHIAPVPGKCNCSTKHDSPNLLGKCRTSARNAALTKLQGRVVLHFPRKFPLDGSRQNPDPGASVQGNSFDLEDLLPQDLPSAGFRSGFAFARGPRFGNSLGPRVRFARPGDPDHLKKNHRTYLGSVGHVFAILTKLGKVLSLRDGRSFRTESGAIGTIVGTVH